MTKKAELIKIVAYCPKLDKNVHVKNENCEWHGYSEDCEMCGSHSGVDLSFNCECGKSHKIELSWM